MHAVCCFTAVFLGCCHALDFKAAAFAASLLFGLSGVAGLLAGGWAADRFDGARTGGRLLLSAEAMAVAAPLVYLVLRQPGGAVVVFVLLMATGLNCL